MNIRGDTIQRITIELNKNEYLTFLWIKDGLSDYLGNKDERDKYTSPYPLLGEVKGLIHCNDSQPNTL